MLRSKTVLVVGAGASCEAEFPDGKSLLQEIGRLLNIRYEIGNRRVSGDDQISRALLNLVPSRQFGDEYNNYLYAAWRICDASALGLSIDNIIEQHDDDERVAVCGKLAILRAILQAERNSLLMPPRGNPDQLDLAALDDTWYIRLIQILTENIPRRQVERVFENISIICFNYDRALQTFLPHALSRSYGMSIGEARVLTSRLKILHPYGRVSPLPWEVQNAGVAFGDCDHAVYDQLVPQIRTFSERIEDEEALQDIRSTIAGARQIIFLGFAFHAPNMALLWPVEPQARRVLATVYQLPENEKRQIERQIRGMLNLAPVTCSPKLLHS